MMKINIPGREEMTICNLVLDYNGTVACNGKVLDGVIERLQRIKSEIDVYILTADTYGTVKKEFENTGIDVHILTKDNGTLEKQEFVIGLGAHETISIGNGNNDVAMLKESGLSIGIIGGEGCAAKVLMNVDIVVTDILEALALVMEPVKMKATLRG